jgi:hypothetical protein
MAAVSSVTTGAVLTLLVTIAIAVAGWAYKSVRRDIDQKADAGYERRVEELETQTEAALAIAQTAYSSVYGADERPDDTGFLGQYQNRLERVEGRQEEMMRRLDGLEADRSLHADRMEEVMREVEMWFDAHRRLREGPAGPDHDPDARPDGPDAAHYGPPRDSDRWRNGGEDGE